MQPIIGSLPIPQGLQKNSLKYKKCKPFFLKTLDIQAPQISQKRNSENLLSFMIAKNFVKSIDMKSTDSNCSAFLCFDFTKLFAIMTESKFSQFLFCEICAWVSVVCNLLLHSSRSRKSTSLYFWIYMSEDLGLKWPFHGGKDIGLYLAARRTLQKVGLSLVDWSQDFKRYLPNHKLLFWKLI